MNMKPKMRGRCKICLPLKLFYGLLVLFICVVLISRLCVNMSRSINVFEVV